jgi:hypothetical protein
MSSFLEQCFAVYNEQGELPPGPYCVVDFANLMHRYKSWEKFLVRIERHPMVVIVGKRLTINRVLFDPAALAESRVRDRLGKTIVVVGVDYARSVTSNIDDVLFWFVVSSIYISMDRQKAPATITLLTHDKQPHTKDTTYLVDSKFTIYEVTPTGAHPSRRGTAIVKTIAGQLMHTSRPRKLTSRATSFRKSPTHFFGYIKFLQSLTAV